MTRRANLSRRYNYLGAYRSRRGRPIELLRREFRSSQKSAAETYRSLVQIAWRSIDQRKGTFAYVSIAARYESNVRQSIDISCIHSDVANQSVARPHRISYMSRSSKRAISRSSDITERKRVRILSLVSSRIQYVNIYRGRSMQIARHVGGRLNELHAE